MTVNQVNIAVRSNETFTGWVGDGNINKAFLACQVVEIIALLVTVWILLCAIIYGFKTKKWRKRPGSDNLDQGIMYSCCVTAIALTLPRIIFTSILLFVHPDIVSPVCEVIMDTSSGLYFFATYPTYFYLWLRQRAIYSHPAAQELTGKCVVLVGWALLFILTILAIAFQWIYIAPNKFKGTTKGCVFDSKNNDGGTLLFVFSVVRTVAQVSFLGLFIYPMIRCELNQIKIGSESVSTSRREEVIPRKKLQRSRTVCRTILCGARNSEQVSPLGITIRRSVYAAIIAMTTDITATMVPLFGIAITTPIVITSTFYDTNVLINSLCILSTFGNNRKILSVFWSCPADDLHESRSQEPTQMNSKSENEACEIDTLGSDPV